MSFPRLHVVTDDDVLASDGFVVRARRVLEAGGDGLALHIRGPRSSGRLLFGLASYLRDRARRSGALLLVNDRVDVALAADVDGAHLGERSLPLAVARRILGEDRVVGASVHDTATLAAVVADGANHAFVGNVYATASHPGREGMGPDGLADVLARAAGIPVLAIGGIEVGKVNEVLRAGAHGVAVLSGVWGRPDPAGAVLDYLAALDEEERR